ncbi:MAG: glycosyltransferase [Holophagales bacterium]|nr:glycosyltransferase [Holophagales bacterium]MXX60446.1 glycosyltransferase [Holophagales bacterium]MYC10097.1 glycosyltransferase [Holophagales bacterium]MYD21369.1 glycosyltransferase [Holophagales bacterium]MYI32623.1 glycosyltransferase [Holophagales bacterium]
MHLAIVMPVLEEAERVQTAIAAAQAHCDELIVIDGGSRDGTAELASDAGARVETVPRAGRGLQLRTGASLAMQAGADVLLFLHADTRLPPAARPGIERAVNSGAAGGGFLIDFAAAPPLLRLGRGLVDIRSRWLHTPLGDQAQFATAAAYAACGGFSDLPILEDLDFIGRLRRQGPISVVEQRATTSSRRFAERGVVRTVATNWLIWSLFAAGVKPARLAGLYPLVR